MFDVRYDYRSNFGRKLYATCMIFCHIHLLYNHSMDVAQCVRFNSFESVSNFFL